MATVLLVFGLVAMEYFGMDASIVTDLWWLWVVAIIHDVK